MSCYPLGLSSDKAELFGKPHIGAVYTSGGRYRRTRERCPVCGRFATNCHHVAPRSVATEMPLVTPLGAWALRSPLIALCGSGTTGCHGRFHERRLAIRWVWYRPSYRDMWWSGQLLSEHVPHSPALYRYGYWEIRDAETGVTLNVRRD